MKSIVVTGTSSGIGRAAAEYLTGRGFRVFGSVRRSEDGEALRAALGETFVPLLFDTTDETAVRAGAAKVREKLADEPLFGLVLNAGIAVPGPLLYVKPEDFRRQLEVSLVGTLLTAQAFAPLLIGPPPGRAVVITSVAGKNALPFNGPYSVAKFGTEAFAAVLRREMMAFGVDAIAIAPGPVQSAIWKKSAAVDLSPLEGTAYAAPAAKALAMMEKAAATALPAARIARAIHHALATRRPRPRYVITPDVLSYYALRLMPARLADRLIAKALGLQ
jgi:NAD(P)-dependent dehydrogenase (short-subunit alcohol dehydrogenase family)